MRTKSFVDVGLRGSGHKKQNNDPPPEFIGTKSSELKSYHEKVRRPEDVATADGVNMILDTLAEAFQGEYDVRGSHTAEEVSTTVREGTFDKCIPVPRDGEEAKTSFFVYFGTDHSTSDYNLPCHM